MAQESGRKGLQNFLLEISIVYSSNNTFPFLTDQITSSNNTFEFLTDQITSSNNTFEFLTDQITSNVDALIISLLFPERQCKIPGYPYLLSLDRDKNGVGIVVMPARTFHSSQTFIFWRKNHWSSSHWTKFPRIKKLRLTCSDNPKKITFPKRQFKIPGYSSPLSLDWDKNGAGIIILSARTFNPNQIFIFWR